RLAADADDARGPAVHRPARCGLDPHRLADGQRAGAVGRLDHRLGVVSGRDAVRLSRHIPTLGGDVASHPPIDNAGGHGRESSKVTKWHFGRRQFLMSTAAAGAGFAMPGIIRANAADATINKWLDEFQPSTLTKDQQIEELTWFQAAAKPFKGMDIKIVSE